MNHSQHGRPVGRVVGLWRYPVKSMAGEVLDAAEVSWHGLAGDRRWAFVRNDAAQSGFPWLTIRERNDMNRYCPSFVDADRPDRSRVKVRTPSGSDFDVADPALAAELCPDGVRAIKQDRGIFDTFPLSLISTRTIAALGASVGQDLDVRRFRPNLLIETTDGAAFAEDAWVGCILRIGGLRMRVDKRDGRCAVITIDPETAQRNTTILRTVARDRQGCLGVYATTVEPGRVALDDYVWIE
ncbi:MAG: MOSC domain-containing protein [Dokdonella sp.]|nr:MOSC domain-containing protein [Dokdonella sp.]MCB1574957.1 MOSC domain-containing protein [Xanthomonadales bacterium]